MKLVRNQVRNEIFRNSNGSVQTVATAQVRACVWFNNKEALWDRVNIEIWENIVGQL